MTVKHPTVKESLDKARAGLDQLREWSNAKVHEDDRAALTAAATKIEDAIDEAERTARDVICDVETSISRVV